MVPAPAGLHMVDEGLWHWERRHPEWHPDDFGAVVGSYLVHTRGVSLLIDPLVDGEDDPVACELDALAQDPVRILISIPYHARSAEFFWRRYADRGALIMGHPLVAKRLSDLSGFRPLSGGEDIEGVARVHRIGRPVRAEMPIEIPSLKALVFGDAIVQYEGALHLWDDPIGSDNRRKWYEERFLPTMRALERLDVERILVTHGRPVLSGGAVALKEALDRGPWPPRGA
jgi:glyoxylase-like metal-dependent hydrolase (beta-lactamase superfamily II)